MGFIFARPARNAWALGMFVGSLACLASCAAPQVRTDAVLGIVTVMDERVDAYVAADDGLNPGEAAALLVYGDAALELLGSADEVPAPELQAHVQGLYDVETAYTLADPALTPRTRAAFLRGGLLVLTICTRAQLLPDPPAVVVPGAEVLEPPADTD